MEPKTQDVNEQLTNSFGYHKPDEATAKRERSLAFTKLEESSMWAVKALVLRCPLG